MPRLIRDRVRERSGFACEFCGVTEVISGGELTVDHFQPRAESGPDDIDNFVYCCIRCNLYKAAWWDENSSGFGLWNPRIDPFQEHFHVAASGVLRDEKWKLWNRKRVALSGYEDVP
jgi:5-methylcytosine-specific restriction endonuclease McrA